MEITVFYSWQSDLPNSTNRGFIQNALQDAINSINKENKFKVKPVMKQGAQDEAGSPSIANAILRSIKKAEIFVADVSIVTAEGYIDGKPTRLTPNPNVLIELGYAAAKIGWSRILMVMNVTDNKVEVLPFDLRHKSIVVYSVKREDESKAEKRRSLERVIKLKLEEILVKVDQVYAQKELPTQEELRRLEGLRIEQEDKELLQRFSQFGPEDCQLLVLLAQNKPNYFTARDIKNSRGGNEEVINSQLERFHDHGLVQHKELGQKIKWGITDLGYRVIKLKGYLT